MPEDFRLKIIKVRTQTICILLCQSSSCSFTKKVIIGHKSIICKLVKFFNRCNWIAFYLNLLIFSICLFYFGLELFQYTVEIMYYFQNMLFKYPIASSIPKIATCSWRDTLKPQLTLSPTPKYVLILEIASGKG